jgi:hypothetical protein
VTVTGGGWRTGGARSGAGAGAGLPAQADSKAAAAMPAAIDLKTLIQAPQHGGGTEAKAESDGPCTIVIPAEARIR